MEWTKNSSQMNRTLLDKKEDLYYVFSMQNQFKLIVM